MKEIYLAGGCFWAVQKYFDLIFGVLETEVGYVNGRSARTNYFRIPKTGHAEAVHIIYNPKVLPLEKLLNYYYEVIDPTSLNKQGNDAGKQYRTGIYYTDKSDVPLIIKSLEELQKKYTKKIVVEVEQLKNFVKAEGYHQDFLKNNPFGYCHIPIQKFEEVKAKQFDDMTYRLLIMNTLIILKWVYMLIRKLINLYFLQRISMMLDVDGQLFINLHLKMKSKNILI